MIVVLAVRVTGFVVGLGSVVVAVGRARGLIMAATVANAAEVALAVAVAGQI